MNHWNTRFEAWAALGYRTPAEYAAACRHTHTPVACEIN
jgi:putative transposase